MTPLSELHICQPTGVHREAIRCTCQGVYRVYGVYTYPGRQGGHIYQGDREGIYTREAGRPLYQEVPERPLYQEVPERPLFLN